MFLAKLLLLAGLAVSAHAAPANLMQDRVVPENSGLIQTADGHLEASNIDGFLEAIYAKRTSTYGDLGTGAELTQTSADKNPLGRVLGQDHPSPIYLDGQNGSPVCNQGGCTKWTQYTPGNGKSGLAFMTLDGTGNWPALVANVRSKNADGTRVVSKFQVDSGSATMAFCPDAGMPITAKPPFEYKCNSYGDGSNGGSKFAGINEHAADPIELLTDEETGHVAYTVKTAVTAITQHTGMQCKEGKQGVGMNGILGIGMANGQLEVLTESKRDPKELAGCLYENNCFMEKAPGKVNGEVGPAFNFKCKEEDVTAKIKMGGDTPLGTVARGLYWSGKIGQKEGELYLGDSAYSNKRAKGAPLETLSVIAVTSPTKATSSLLNHNLINIKSIAVKGQAVQGAASACGKPGHCFLDCGMPLILLGKEVYANAVEAKEGTIEITAATLCGPPDGDLCKKLDQPLRNAEVKLQLDIKTLLDNGWLGDNDTNGGVTLGLGFNYFYYTVWDQAKDTHSFVKMA